MQMQMRMQIPIHITSESTPIPIPRHTPNNNILHVALPSHTHFATLQATRILPLHHRTWNRRNSTTPLPTTPTPTAPLTTPSLPRPKIIHTVIASASVRAVGMETSVLV